MTVLHFNQSAHQQNVEEMPRVQINFNEVYVFTRDSIYAIAHICHGNSVCLSVRLSHGWIRQKWLKLGSRNFHHTVAPSL